MTYYFRRVYINNKYSLLSSTKYNPIVKDNVDKSMHNYYLNQKTIELAESKYQEYSIQGLLLKSGLVSKNIDLLINGDLQNQILASTLASSKVNIPTLGIYSACATFVEGLCIGSMFLENNKGKIIVTTSSHNLVSEKQFRFPVEYGSIKKRVNTCTATGSVSALLTNKKSNIRIESATIGKVVQTNHKDANDMGSAMAPSCAEVIYKHLYETNRDASYYDLILTGDLGEFGLKITLEYLRRKYKMSFNNVIDSGSIFYKDENIYAGASGPICLPLVLFDYIIPLKKYKKILIVATGSLHSPLSSNLKIPMPGISHAISLEVDY